MIRRHPDAVLTAHRMDPDRRELYVEGKRDRLFLSWLLGPDSAGTARVLEIAFVEIPESEGGERGRLMHFAHWLADRDVRIRMFADADWDRLLGRAVPERVWLTDHRDMEGYILRVECIDKVLRLGVATDRIDAESLLRILREYCRQLGILRLLSESDSLNLPFGSTGLRRFLKGSRGQLNLDLDGYIRALLQNAGIGLRQMKSLRGRLTELEDYYAGTPDTEIIHGKDATCIIEVALSHYGVRQEEGQRLLWSSFETEFVEAGSTLESVLVFIRAA